MRAVLQRCTRASVRVGGEKIGEIGQGYCILLGATHTDTEETARQLARKIATLRVFEDADGKMNRSLLDVGGAALVVSQFTLYADTRKGRRPAFVDAARPEQAEPLYECFCGALRSEGVHVATGQFQADMEVSIVNDGPVTIILET